MKISELIEQLEYERKLQGDLPVMWSDGFNTFPAAIRQRLHTASDEEKSKICIIGDNRK